MPAQLGHQLARECDSVAASARLWRLGQKTTLVQLRRRLDNADFPCHKINVLSPKPHEFTPAQPCKGSQQRHHPVTHGQCISDREHDRQRSNFTLRRFLDACTIDPAWVPANEPVMIGSRGKDRMQQPVCLGDHHRTERPSSTRPSPQALLPPAAYCGLVNVGHAHGAERGQQMVSQQRSIQVHGAHPEHTILQPLLGIVAKEHRTTIRVEPVTLLISTSLRASQRTASDLRVKVCGAGRSVPSGAR
jgi:hypothetical protein